MIHVEGINYHFFLCNSDSVARVKTKISPFYDFPVMEIEELPYLYSQPAIIPSFLYEIDYARRTYQSRPMSSPPYLSFQNGRLWKEDGKFPQGARELSNGSLFLIDSNPYKTKGNPPIIVLRAPGEATQIGVKRNVGTFRLFRQNRTRMNSTRYLSLRDVVNPELNENEVSRKIESLYFDPKSKNYLFRLVKILYAGTPVEEQTIVSNLFAFEPEFAAFLRDRIFSIEILPLIHGPFLNSILNSVDERILKFSIPSLSLPVRNMVEKNVSKNRWKQILDGPSKQPNLGESFEEVVEKEIFRRFSRKIYYEEGIFHIYWEQSEESQIELGARQEIQFSSIPSDKYNFNREGEGLELYSVTGDKILFQTNKSLEILRFDILISKREKDSYEMFRIPEGGIVDIPRYDQTKLVVGAGIASDRKPFEFSLLSYNY
ncbi:hypothetical protein LEP1GSC050_1449 [Leptospira broomii serovar Hurstbridge str. 5399]|uniref:Uncharacterized protein n=1 Tax=Leptospira broomii serovar Hurstbridge str. 5399 TaxID=1049789 RepID=T0GD90_9LEPT|nr:hypothetical protein [Leptospira broomii]EQA43383.1 hypothetical protein LEP1GSC050_1449 [Leptospira broomii serovar Hurstbridge str. 5399]